MFWGGVFGVFVTGCFGGAKRHRGAGMVEGGLGRVWGGVSGWGGCLARATCPWGVFWGGWEGGCLGGAMKDVSGGRGCLGVRVGGVWRVWWGGVGGCPTKRADP
jgi:hypothetical protein